MDYTISLQTVFWLCAGIAGVCGVVAIARKPFVKRNDHETRISSLESKADERRAIDQYTTRALNAIVNHMIDGNGIDELKDVRREYQNSLIDRL